VPKQVPRLLKEEHLPLRAEARILGQEPQSPETEHTPLGEERRTLKPEPQSQEEVHRAPKDESRKANQEPGSVTNDDQRQREEEKFQDLSRQTEPLISNTQASIKDTQPMAAPETWGDARSPEDEMRPLSEQLYAEESEFLSTFPPGHGDLLYWPGDLINKLVNEKMVRWELNKARTPYSNELVKYILADCKKLFVIAADIDPNESDRKWLMQVMQIFYKKSFRDNSLSPEISTDTRCLVQDELINLDRKVWRRDLARKMCDQQWTALVPVLSTNKANYDLDARAILPFKTISAGVPSLGGAFSVVYKIEIHPGHLEDPSGRVSAITRLATIPIRGEEEFY